jgi:crotonobetaine/carnitine-CoA ligase
MSEAPAAETATAAWPPLGEQGKGLPADVVTLVGEACDRDPERPALIFEDGVTVTRGQFKRAVESFAGYLARRIEPGDRVAIVLPNRTEFMVAWLAVNACGGSLVSINTAAGEHDAGHILGDSAATMAIVGRDQEELVRGLAGPELGEVVVVDDDEPDGLGAYTAGSGPLSLEGVRIDPEAITNVYYTSGTTGPPKGCTVDHSYWLRFVELYLGLYGLSDRDRLLCCLQFFYNDPPWLFLTSLWAGTSLVVMRRFSVSRYWSVVTAHDVNRVFGLAAIPSLLLKAEPSPAERDQRVEFALHVGIPTALHREFVERWGFPWVEGYGLTESGLVIAMPLEHADEMTGSGSIGLACPGVEVRLVDDEGDDVDADEPGELLIRAPGLMRGYLNRPEATAETMREGWLHTGDLGRQDRRGFVYFLGRKKDIVRRSGENVAAVEVEDVLRSHPLVLEAAVIPVADELRGEEVKACIALVDGTGPEDVSEFELVSFCRERLAPHKVPRYIQFRAEPFPRTPSMRVKKSAIVAESEDPLRDTWDRDSAMPDWKGSARGSRV